MGLVNKPKAASTPAPKLLQTGSAASKPAAVASEQKGGGEDGKPKTKSAYQLFCDEKRSEVKGERGIIVAVKLLLSGLTMIA